MAGTQDSAAGRPPVREIRSGGISAAIWERPATDGRSGPLYSVRIQKKYHDPKSSEFKSTEYYFPADLPRLILVAEKAFEFVSLRSNGSPDDDD